MHDMRLDKAAAAAITLPAFVASTSMLEKALSPTFHTHVERASIPRGSSLPNMKPPRDDGRKYIQNKKLILSGGGDAVSIWPSV